MSDNSQQSGFKKLIVEAKSKGYLVHEDLLNFLPNHCIDPSKMDEIIGILNEMNIKVFEVPPTEDEALLLSNQGDTEDAMTDAVEVLATETRTTDPVRMYMREMGSVELLTREGEIVIAKRIEEGSRQVMSALTYYPMIIDSIIKDYRYIVENEGRINELITDFFDGTETIADPKPPSKPKEKTDEAKDDGENKESEDDKDSDEFVDTGPDVELANEYINTLEKLQKKYISSHKKNGSTHKTTIGAQKKLAEHFSKFKLAIK